MSTTSANPKLEKKNKSKDGSEKKSKKRKHQSDETANALEVEPVSAKKQRKSKADRKSDATPQEPSAEKGDADEASSPAKEDSHLASKPAKKIKRKQKDEHDTAGSTQPQASSAEAGAADTASHESDISEKNLHRHSPFVHQTSSLYLPLSPMAHSFPLAGLCGEHISPHLLSYYPPLKGVMISYSNPRLSETAEEAEERSRSSTETGKSVLARSVDEYAVTFVWLIADYLLFRPRKGTVLEGYINVQNESVLGLVCYNYFNAGVERQRLPKDWSWVGGERQGRKKEGEEAAEGYYIDGEGKKVEGRVLFRVVDFQANGASEVGGGSIDIVGSLLSKEEDANIEEQSRRETAEKGGEGGRRVGS